MKKIKVISPAGKRSLAKCLEDVYPELLKDLVALGTVLGPFESLEIELEDEQKQDELYRAMRVRMCASAEPEIAAMKERTRH